jgi:hypothetical protein
MMNWGGFCPCLETDDMEINWAFVFMAIAIAVAVIAGALFLVMTPQ